MPGTGPYKIASYVQGKGFTLKRNHFFSRWSAAAQPDGYPDTIQWRFATSQQALDGVLRGAGDVDQIGGSAFGEGTGQVLHDLRVQHPTMLKSDPLLDTEMEQFNTRLPPFNNRLARQAVNFATDRNKLVKLWGGPELATPTCQMLPPNFPGYHYYCPFGMTDTNGRYVGPDLARAKALVRLSGTRGQHVRVDVVDAPGLLPGTSYFADVLRALGYHVTVRKLDPSRIDLVPFYKDPRNKIQIANAAGWLADFPAPSDFYDPLFSCAGFSRANPATNFNVSEFCDPTIDDIAARAHAADLRYPAKANRLWRQVDQKLTYASPAVFTFNRQANTLISPHVGNYTRTPLGYLIFDQVWVQ
jgi:peptide/nickel transport system substrate-binding protein